MSEVRRALQTHGLTAPDLIHAIAVDRDREAFARLFQRFAPKVKAYYLRMGLTDDSAEELAQETLLAVWRKADQYDPERAGAWSWIYTIARNLRIDLLRRERRPLDLAPVSDVDTDTPERRLDAAEDETQVRSALAALPADQAQVVRMAYYEDASHTEIADRLGLPLGTVKSRIRRATEKLRSSLENLL